MSVSAPRPSGRGSWLRAGPIAVGVVTAMAGLMFAISAMTSGGARHGDDMASQIRRQVDTNTEITDEINRTYAEIDRLSQQTNDDAGVAQLSAKDRARLQMASGSAVVAGSGIEVSLDDAPTSIHNSEMASPDDLVVHQQDVQAVMNALWVGGAEAMTVQGHRVTSTTSVRCVGSTLLIKGRLYSPPYAIAAIGDPDKLKRALADSPEVQTYLQWAEQVKLGWAVDVMDSIKMPAAESGQAMDYAEVVEGSNVFAVDQLPSSQETGTP